MVRGVSGGLLLALLALPTPGVGQMVVGTVTESGSDRPVVGAMVRLHTAGGPTPFLWLTAGDGRYTLRAPGAGSYWLEVERIGFRSARFGPVEVEADQTVERDVSVDTEPLRLEGLDVETSARRCSLDGPSGGQAQLLWDEARKALAAATWTQRAAGLHFQVEQRVRSLDARGWTVTDEERSDLTTVGGNSVRSLPPDDLAEGGYVREQEGLVYYYGPDAEALLSDPFLRTHCFEVVRGPEDEPHLVGLSFEPVPDRDTTDIEGVLLLDRATGRLDRVEFSYTGLREAPGRDQARGMVRFLELEDGRWVVREWFIRAPVVVLERSIGAGGQLVERPAVDRVQEFGSRVRSVEGADGISWRADQPRGALRGTVWDSIAGEPLAGAQVRLAGRGWRTVADDEGRWLLEEVPPGSYQVTFGHPRLDTLGVVPAGAEVLVEAEEATEVALAVPSRGRILALACPDPDAGVVVGFVRDGVGRALSGVEVWLTVEPDGESVQAGVTDADGTFRICGLPVDREVTAEAVLGPLASPPVSVRTVGGAAVRVDLAVGAATQIRTELAPGERPVLVGSVTEHGSGAPVDGVEVTLLDDGGEVRGEAVTDSEGAFRIQAGAPGPYVLRARRLGYAGVEDHPVELGAGTRTVQVRMAPEALDVEGVVVEVEGRDVVLERAGFYARRAQGLGLFFDRDELEAMNLQETGDIVHRVGGLASLPQSSRGSMDANRRFLMFRRAARGSSACMPAIFVDGSRIREGGDWRSAMPSLDEIIPADEVEAMELYDGPASAPSRFSSMGAACGVIVIWSRSTGRF